MTESAFTYPFLCASAFAGGAINAIAGGGTLFTFPALLAITSPVMANGTSTLALLPGSLASAAGYRKELSETMPALKILWLPSLLGGIIGAFAVTRFPEKVFETLIPWLLLLASTLLVLQKPLARWISVHPHQAAVGSTLAGIVFFQFLVGIYGGYFGAGIGILMLSSLAFMGVGDIHRMNALKAILASTMNGISAVIFAAEGKVVWKYALVMAVAAIAGGYVGARVARKIPAARVRVMVIVIGFGIAAYSFYHQFIQ